MQLKISNSTASDCRCSIIGIFLVTGDPVFWSRRSAILWLFFIRLANSRIGKILSAIHFTVGTKHVFDLIGIFIQIFEIFNIVLDVNITRGVLGITHRGIIGAFGSGQGIPRGFQSGFGGGNLVVDLAVLAVNSAVGRFQLGGVLGVHSGGLVGGLFLLGGILTGDRDVLEGLFDLIGDGLLASLVNQLVDHAVKGVLRVGVGIVGVNHSLGGVGLGLSEGVLILGLDGGGGVSGGLLGGLLRGIQGVVGLVNQLLGRIVSRSNDFVLAGSKNLIGKGGRFGSLGLGRQRGGGQEAQGQAGSDQPG